MAVDNSSLTTAERKRLTSHEEVIEKGLQSFMDVGNALVAIRDEALYTDVDATFEGYCKKRWGFTSSRARQIIDAAHAAKVVESVTIVTPVNEAQARVLAALPSEQVQATVWSKAVETAPKDKDGNPKITAAHVKKVADEVAPKPPAKPSKPAKAAPPPEPEPAADEPEAGGYEPHEAQKPLGSMDKLFCRMMEHLSSAEQILGKPKLSAVHAGLDAAYKALVKIRGSLRRAG